MTTFIIVFVALLAFAVFYMISLYNNLVSLKFNVQKAWANIDVLMKQRHDELPKLVETCKQYMTYEQETLEKIVTARSNLMKANDGGDIAQVGKMESELRSSLGKLFAVVENYPELKASDTFKHLQKRITDIENSISDRRELYNEQVNINNTRIEQFPDILIARSFHFGHAALLEFEKTELTDVDMKALF